MRNEMSYQAGRTRYPVQRLGAGRAVSFLALVLIGVVLIGAEPYPVRAADGDIDKGFGSDGVVLTDFIPDGDNQGEAVVIQPDGKIVAGGNAITSDDEEAFGVLARFNPDGSLDASFGKQGKAMVEKFNGIEALAIQPDGKLVAGGGAGTGVALLRFNPDGSLDPSFGSGGKVATGGVSILALAIQQDGKIVAGGFRSSGTGTSFTNTFSVLRLNSDGTSDEGFGVRGLATAKFGSSYDYVNSLALQPDGKIVAAGSTEVRSGPDFAVSFAIARFNANGSLDAAFGAGGLATTDFTRADIRSLVPLDDGKILALGRDSQTTGDFVAAARYNGDGTLDRTFGTRGKVTSQFFVENSGRLKTVEMAPDGSFVAAGRALDPPEGRLAGLALARYHNDGSPDLSFGTGGKVITRISDKFDGDTASALAFQADGRIVAVGDSATYDHMAVARYDATAPDFALAFSEPTLNVGSGTNVRVTLNISRGAGFSGDITVTPSDTTDLRIKVKPGSVRTLDASVSFKIKVKGNAPIGPQQITFTGKSDFGATRTTQLVVVVQ